MEKGPVLKPSITTCNVSVDIMPILKNNSNQFKLGARGLNKGPGAR